MRSKMFQLLLVVTLGVSFSLGGCKKAQKNASSQPTARPVPQEIPAPTDPVDPVQKPKPK
jgi:hypothetical protein